MNQPPSLQSLGRHGVARSAAGTFWYRLTVDRRAGQVVARCAGDPVPGCAAGRWRIQQYGLVRAYLLGR